METRYEDKQCTVFDQMRLSFVPLTALTQRHGIRDLVTCEVICGLTARSEDETGMARQEETKHEQLVRYLISRRQILKMGAAGLGTMAVPGLMRDATAAPAEPLHFIGWQYNPQIVAENVDIFKKLSGENVEYQLVPGEYPAVAETKLMGGEPIDMMYAEVDRLVRWHSAGWVRDVEDQPGVAEIKAGMFANSVQGLSLPDGKLGGLPYFAGFDSFIYNAKHLDQAKIQPPTTWEACLDQCRKLKRDKIAEYPYISAWQRTWASLSWSLFSVMYSEGADVFDAKGNFIVDEPFKKVLDMHRTMYSEGLVQPDIFTIEQESVPSFATGQHSFMVVHEYDQKVLNDPKLSQIPGAVHNALMPGKTRSTLTWVSLYAMGAKPVDSARAWELMKFFGGKSKDGQYHVIKRWALDFGLGTPYKEVLDDPEVRKSFAQWKDLAISAEQQQIAKTREVSKKIWFADWDWYMMGEMQDYFRGNQSQQQLIDKLAKKVDEVKAQYPE
jgi:multiple sugar transport system substrate-binding protein